MEDAKKESWEPLWGTPQQFFQCPCGKAYRSYPALFTHVKNKHQGRVFPSLTQAPGSIIKPHSPPKKRGRPPVHKKDASSETSVTLRTEADSSCFSDCEIQQKPAEDALQMGKISNILESLPRQKVNGRLNEVTAIL